MIFNTMSGPLADLDRKLPRHIAYQDKGKPEMTQSVETLVV